MTRSLLPPQMLRPSSPLVPTPLFSYSARVAGCSALTIDAIASSGSGGRGMTARWAVTSESVDVTNITAYIANTSNLNAGSLTLTIPGELVTVGTYSVYLTLTNFLGSRATSPPALVRVSGAPIPAVTIMPARISMLRSEALNLYAEVRSPRHYHKWAEP
jgi:hypothetical protein